MSRGNETASGFRGPNVCEIVGITYRQLDYWARTDLIRPSIADAKGSGSSRIYSYRDLLELKVIKQMLDSGISLRAARRALDTLRKSGEDVTTANLVMDGDSALLAQSPEEVIDLLRGGQGVFNILPMKSVKDEIDAAIIAFPPKPEPEAKVKPERGTKRRTG